MVASAVSISSANEIRPSHIHEDASWFAHLDFQAAANSEMLGELMNDTADGQKSAFSRWVESRYGVEASDLDGLTVYSSDAEGKRTISLVYGDIQQSRLLDTVKRHTDVAKEAVGEFTVYTWQVTKKDAGVNAEENAAANQSESNAALAPEQISAVFLDEVTVFGRGNQAVRQAASRIVADRGQAAGIEAKPDRIPENTLLYASVREISESNSALTQDSASRKQAWAVVDQLDQVSVAIGELSEGKAFIAIEAEAKSEDSARRVSEVFDGLRALASLSGTDSKDLNLDYATPEVNRDGRSLQVGWKVDTKRLAKIVGNQLETIENAATEKVNAIDQQLSADEAADSPASPKTVN
jgi:hypothetical protein